MNLRYMQEADVERIITKLRKEAEKLRINHIKNPAGFSGHLRNVGNLAYEIANKPVFNGKINPDVVKAAGFNHDIGKIIQGDAYHEIVSAAMVLERGEEFGLVRGGTAPERKEALIQIANCIPANYAIPEEIGDNFPETALYPKLVSNELIGQIRILEEVIGEPLLKIATPNTLEKAIVCYADLKRENIGIEEVMDGIGKRYEKYGEKEKDLIMKDYWGKITEITENPFFRTRILGVCGLIESFLK